METATPFRIDVESPSGTVYFTGTFSNWQQIMERLTEEAINEEQRSDSKTAMVLLQMIIVACRGNRMFQRDTIPPWKEIKVALMLDNEIKYLKTITDRFGGE